MSIQETLIIIKPDGLEKGVVGQILRSLQANSLSVVDCARIHLEKSWVEKLYMGEEKEVYFRDVVNWVSSAPVLFLKIHGEQAIEKVRWNVVGRYPNGIRGEYSENWIKNVAHAPNSYESAQRELSLSEPIFYEKKEVDKKLFKGKMVFALTGMSECGKSTAGKYFDSQGIPRLKIVRLFEKVRDKWSPNEELYQFTRREEDRDQYALWDAFVSELLTEMNTRNVSMSSIESLYGGGFGPYLKYRLNNHFCIAYIDIPLEIRLERQMYREELASVEDAKKILIPRDKVKVDSGIPALKEISEAIIDNSGTVQNLYEAINKMVACYK